MYFATQLLAHYTNLEASRHMACVQATRSNGWSAHQVAVEWATSAFVLLAPLSVVCYSFTPDTLAPFRLFDLLYLYQWTVSSALLGLNLSLTGIYNKLCMGDGIVFRVSDLSSINNVTSPEAWPPPEILRSLSRYTGISVENLWVSPNMTAANYISDIPVAFVQELSSAGDVQLVTLLSTNVLQAGVIIYVNSIGTATANSFITVFLVLFDDRRNIARSYLRRASTRTPLRSRSGTTSSGHFKKIS
ncbi:hypothetical protein EDB19DRAFT_1989403 [Suillus lakei]|nr:hypothetical protein EDB19DRAFT_1989403 [Suillus lakei]